MKQNGGSTFEDERHSLVRVGRPIMFNPDAGRSLDNNYVAPRFYNCFSASLLKNQDTAISFAVGITSANASEGKTLVASNLAVSLAVAQGKDTLLVDFNFKKPRLHTIFGTRLSPGLGEAANEATISVSPTLVKHLYVLSAGAGGSMKLLTETGTFKNNGANRSVELDTLPVFRDIMYSLRQEFEFIVIDLPAIHDPAAPLLLTGHMNGLLVVVDTLKTKQRDLDHAMTVLNKSHVTGFVLNRFNSDVR